MNYNWDVHFVYDFFLGSEFVILCYSVFRLLQMNPMFFSSIFVLFFFHTPRQTTRQYIPHSRSPPRFSISNLILLFHQVFLCIIAVEVRKRSACLVFSLLHITDNAYTTSFAKSVRSKNVLS